MNRLLQNRLVLQLLLTSAAALSLSAISVILITDAVRNADRVVLSEANKTIAAAVAELKQHYQDRALSASSWQSLPEQSRDSSLRQITQTVLRSFPGVEGGFYASNDFLGYAFPTHDTGASKTDVPSAERDLIASLATRSANANTFTAQVIRGRTDLLVLGAAPASKRGPVVWTMKRLPGKAKSGAWRHELLLSILAAAALASIAGSLATGLSLARGVAQIKNGLSLLEQDFEFRLPERSDELAVISRSVNQMARVRGKLERELRREDRLRALGRLTAGLAHEIRNPLNSISLTVQLLERRLDTNSIRRQDLRTVRTEVDRLSVLLNDLLDLQRLRQHRPERQSILPVLQHCVSVVEPQAHMQNVTVLLEAEDFTAFFDSRQLTQTIVNLLLNALEASPNGSVVHVRTLLLAGVPQVLVDDQGPGLAIDAQEHLFEPFFTTKPAGTGLGLAVSRELMRSQGGDLRLEPELYRAVSLRGFRLLFLNALDTSQHFDFSAAQMKWLEEQLKEAQRKGLRPLVFTHLYPSELRTQGKPFSQFIREFNVELVEMGHTHYNELANDGRTIYAATRSTGQIEEGPPGFSITTIDDDVVSWKFKERGPWPFVMITSPADERLITRPSSSRHVVRGFVSIKAKIWGSSSLTSVVCSVDQAAPQPMQLRDHYWELRWDSHSVADGRHSVLVAAETSDGRQATDQISILVNQAGYYDPPPRHETDYENAIGPYETKGILGTELGPNEKGTKGPWPSWRAK